MHIFILLILTFLGGFIAKFIFLHINRLDFYNIFQDEFPNLSKKYLLYPFFSNKFLKSRVEKLKLKKKKYGELLRLSIISEVFGAVIFGIFSIFITNTLQQYGGFSTLIYLTIIIFFTISLLYLAIYDIISFSIPERFVKWLSLIAIIVNILVVIVKLLSQNLGEPLLINIPLGNLDNLLSGITFALIIWLVVKITKEKGMGEGDVYLVLIIGLVLGWPNTLISFLSTLILGSLISIAISAYLKKFRNVIVPFVPFLLLGYIVALAFGGQLYLKFFFI